MHMHVASTTIFEGPAPSEEELRDHIESRLHLVPRFRQKLRFVPLGQGRPVWVDDPQFNLDYHVRHTALPPPGSEEQLRTLAARIFSQRLDRTKPVWEMWLVDGLEGNRFALVTKCHHCLVDGVSGVDITTVLFDLDREAAETTSPEPWLPQPEPSNTQLLGEALLDRATNPVEIVRGARDVVTAPRRFADAAAKELGAAGSFLRTGLRSSGLAHQLRHRPLSPVRVGTHRPGGHEEHQERRGRNGQRRRGGGGIRRARALPARARALDRRARASSDGADQRAGRRRARLAGEPGLGDDGPAPRR